MEEGFNKRLIKTLIFFIRAKKKPNKKKRNCSVQNYPEKEKTSLANFLSRAVLEALVSTRTTLMWPGLSLTRLLVYVMSVSSVTSTKSFLGGRLHGPKRKTKGGKEKGELHLYEL